MSDDPESLRADSSQSTGPGAREQAEVKEIVAALRERGVLTLTELRELCWAGRWPERDFTAALRQAVASGEIRHLGDERYTIAKPQSPSKNS